MMRPGIHHVMVAMPANGEEQARRFYGALLGLVPQAGSLSACSARYNVRDDSSKRLTELAEPFPAKGTSTASWKFLRMFGTLQRA